MNDPKFLICEHCGNLVGVIHDAGVPMMCCGQKMKQLIPGEVEAAGEKHVPVIKVNGNKVTVEIGEVAHPMTEPHLIKWVYLQTLKGGMRKTLGPVDAPVVEFELVDDEPIAAYAYCNLHGLWKGTV